MDPRHGLHLFPAVSMVQAGRLYRLKAHPQTDPVVQLPSFVTMHALHDDKHIQILSKQTGKNHKRAQQKFLLCLHYSRDRYRCSGIDHAKHRNSLTVKVSYFDGIILYSM